MIYNNIHFSLLQNRHNTTTTTLHRYDSDRSNQALIPNGGYDREREKEKIIEKDKTVIKKEESKNVEGPPVYYPPGVELFSKKEEAMMAQQQVIIIKLLNENRQ